MCFSVEVVVLGRSSWQEGRLLNSQVFQEFAFDFVTNYLNSLGFGLIQWQNCFFFFHLKNNAGVVVVVLLQASSMALRSSIDQISSLVFPSSDGIGPVYEIAESVKQVGLLLFVLFL